MRLSWGVAVAVVLTAAAPARGNVSLKNGNFFVGYTDVVYPGGFEPKIERVYNSKSGFKGIFGWGWGIDLEVYLVPLPDRGVVIHEYGGGAENVFLPADYRRADIDAGLDALVAAARKAGQLSTPQAAEDYRARMDGDPQARRDAWEKLLRAGHAAAPAPQAGTELVSNRFGHQVVTPTPAGYQRRLDSGRREDYDTAGRLVRISDANGNWIDLGHDPAGRMISIADNFGRRIDLAYDAKGFVRELRADRGRRATYRYDAHDDLVESRDVDGNAYRYSYDRIHNLTRIDYADKTSMQIAYYPRDRLDSVRMVTDRDGTATVYAYRHAIDGMSDTVGVEVFDPSSPTGPRRISRSLYQYEYARARDGSEYTRRMATDLDGDITDTTYNPAGLPLRIARGGEITTFEYDRFGHVTRKETPTEIRTLAYDVRVGKVTRVETTRKAGNQEVTWSEFAYDDRGNLTRAADSGGRAVTLTYDGNGRIDTLTDQKGQVLRFTYNANSKPTEIALEGVGSIVVTYNPDGEIKNVSSSTGDRKIALTVTSAFQNLLDVIRPAGVSLSF